MVDVDVKNVVLADLLAATKWTAEVAAIISVARRMGLLTTEQAEELAVLHECPLSRLSDD